MPSVVRVREWYKQSFVELRRSKAPIDVDTEQVGSVLMILASRARSERQ